MLYCIVSLLLLTGLAITVNLKYSILGHHIIYGCSIVYSPARPPPPGRPPHLHEPSGYVKSTYEIKYYIKHSIINTSVSAAPSSLEGKRSSGLT